MAASPPNPTSTGTAAGPDLPAFRAERVIWLCALNTRGARDAGVGPSVSLDQLLELTALLGFAEDLYQDLQEPLGGIPVRGSVVRVELGYRERGGTFIAEQRAQYLAACPQRWGGAAIRVLRQRRVEEVDQVDVEVDGQTVTGGERRESGSSAA